MWVCWWGQTSPGDWMKVQTQTQLFPSFSSVIFIYTEGATAAGGSKVDGFAKGGGQVCFSEGLWHCLWDRVRREKGHFKFFFLTWQMRQKTTLGWKWIHELSIIALSRQMFLLTYWLIHFFIQHSLTQVSLNLFKMKLKINQKKSFSKTLLGPELDSFAKK